MTMDAQRVDGLPETGLCTTNQRSRLSLDLLRHPYSWDVERSPFGASKTVIIWMAPTRVGPKRLPQHPDARQ